MNWPSVCRSPAEDLHGAGLSCVPQANAVVQHSKVNVQAIIISFIICR
jgi:hypothetical protein